MNLGRLAKRYMMETVLLTVSMILAFNAEGFFSTLNLLNVLHNVSMQGVIAFGMTMVIICGEIDLSVGSAVAFAGCLTAYVTEALMGAGFVSGVAVSLAIAASFCTGYCVGCLTGFFRTKYQVPTFITTLAWMTILTGSAQLITNSFPISSFPDWYNFFGGGYVFGIPFPAIVFVSVFLLTHFVMEHTTFGRSIYAIGGNPEAARLSGINVTLVKIQVMGLVALLAALSGVMLSAQIMSGTPTAAKGWELDVISAVIIGGTSLMGGEGTIRGTLMGVIFLGVIVNGMTIMDFDTPYQLVIRGVLILFAVLANRMQSR